MSDDIKPQENTPENAATVQGLIHWYTHVFNKYGWMVVHTDDKGKWECYIDSVGKLVAYLGKTITEVDSKDKKRELTIMQKKTQELLSIAMKASKYNSIPEYPRDPRNPLLIPK